VPQTVRAESADERHACRQARGVVLEAQLALQAFREMLACLTQTLLPIEQLP
jgi:hypothetical protein